MPKRLLIPAESCIFKYHGYTHLSISPATQLKQAYEIDLSAIYWLINVSQYQLGVLGGYQYNTFKWDGIGGTYSYNNGADVGVFPNTVGIDYKQEFNALYLGLVGAYKFKQSEIGMQVKWSPWVNAKDKDNHYDRDLTFYDNSHESSDFLSVSVNYDYHYTQSVTLFAEYVYSQYSEAKTDVTIVNTKTGVTSYAPNGEGLDNEHSTITVGVKYRF
ncbi:omptin family outer membrane protease [uncultured Shewanella sp.]|uniref:omptin family outer membrane protease n=1 Tax=uncultured Shewanella sp. TaxID=173975 RepID=UPI00261AEAFF|nr:omptin family outer membrane protease [uncultured Shewanella sp.]